MARKGAVALACVVVSACADPGAETRAARISPDVTLVEDASLVAPDRLEFEADTADPIRDRRPGDVLVSGTGAGFLRRVLSVEEEGGRIVVLTAPAVLTDAIVDGEVESSIGPAPPGAPSRSGSWAGGEGDDEGGFAAGIGGITVVDDVNLTVTITGGHFDFRPDVDLALDIENRRLERFEAVARGDVDAAVSLTVRADDGFAAGRYQKRIWGASETFVQMIGWVPVVEVVELTLGVGVQVEGRGRGSVSLGGSTTAALEAGARYENDAWEPVGDATVSFEALPVAAQGEAMAGVRAYVYAEVALRLYDVAGPSILVLPYVGATRDAERWDAKVGVMGLFLAKVSVPIVDRSWVGYQSLLFDLYRDPTGELRAGDGASLGMDPSGAGDGMHDDDGDAGD